MWCRDLRVPTADESVSSFAYAIFVHLVVLGGALPMRISHPLSHVISHLQVGYTAVIYILRKS